MPDFVRINLAFNDALSYYYIDKIKDHILKLAGTINMDYVDTQIQYSYNLHNDVIQEIKQNISGSTPNTVIEMFEYLKTLVAFLESNTPDKIRRLINEYNDKAEKDFNIKIEKEVHEFQQSEEYLTRQHKEEYEYRNKFAGLFAGINHIPKTVKKVHYKFYQIESTPEYIDMYYFPEYIKLIEGINGTLLRNVNHYLDLYKSGKIAYNTGATFQVQPVDASAQSFPRLPVSRVIEHSVDDTQKLKVNLTAKQIAYLFKLLQESKVIPGLANKEICMFIQKNFATQKTNDMDLKNLENIFGEPEKATAVFWEKKLKEMRDKALSF